MWLRGRGDDLILEAAGANSIDNKYSEASSVELRRAGRMGMGNMGVECQRFRS